MHITDTLLLAADAAAAATARARAEPPIEIPESLIDSTIATLPERAAEARLADPDAPAFRLLTWHPLDRPASAAAAAAAATLKALGLTPSFRTERVGASELPCELLLEYADLDGAAARETKRREEWVDTARKLWLRSAGSGATVDVLAHGTTTTLMLRTASETTPAALLGGTRISGMHTHDTTWPQRQPEQVVAEAVAALRPVLWTQDDVARLWRERAGGTVERLPLHYDAGTLERVPAVVFSPEKGDAKKSYPVYAVHGLTAEALVARAAEDLGVALKAAKKR